MKTKRFIRLNDGRIIDAKDTYEQPNLNGVVFCTNDKHECVYEDDIHSEADTIKDLIKVNDLIRDTNGKLYGVQNEDFVFVNGKNEVLPLIKIAEFYTYDGNGMYLLVAVEDEKGGLRLL